MGRGGRDPGSMPFDPPSSAGEGMSGLVRGCGELTLGKLDLRSKGLGPSVETIFTKRIPTSRLDMQSFLTPDEHGPSQVRATRSRFRDRVTRAKCPGGGGFDPSMDPTLT